MVGFLYSVQPGEKATGNAPVNLTIQNVWHISLTQGGVFHDSGSCFLSCFEENVALHQANFVKSKPYRVVKGCEIVGDPSLYIVLCCAYTVLLLYALTLQTVLYTNS